MAVPNLSIFTLFSFIRCHCMSVTSTWLVRIVFLQKILSVDGVLWREGKRPSFFSYLLFCLHSFLIMLADVTVITMWWPSECARDVRVVDLICWDRSNVMSAMELWESVKISCEVGETQEVLDPMVWDKSSVKQTPPYHMITIVFLSPAPLP